MYTVFSRKTSRNETILEDNIKMDLIGREQEVVESIEVGQNKKQSEIYEEGTEPSVSKISGEFLAKQNINF
jgi:hypothetical protein